jgi:UDP-glucose 4-epimerase
VTVLRFFNTYGPRIHVNGYGSVVARFIRQALRGETITVHGDGGQTRSFTYVEDTVAGILSAGQVAAEGRVFNVGNPRETTVLDLALMIKTLSGATSDIVLAPYADYYGHSYEDTRRRLPDITRAKAMLGFNPRISLEEGLRRTIGWCRANGFAGPAAAPASRLPSAKAS